MQGGSLLGRTFGDNGGKQEGSRTEQREKLNCASVETEDSADTARMFETWMAFHGWLFRVLLNLIGAKPVVTYRLVIRCYS